MLSTVSHNTWWLNLQLMQLFLGRTSLEYHERERDEEIWLDLSQIHDRQKGQIPSTKIQNIQLEESQRRERTCVGGGWGQSLSLATSTSALSSKSASLTTSVIASFFVAPSRFAWQNIEPAVHHHEASLVFSEFVEGGHLQDHQHPPRAPEDQVWGKVDHKTTLSSQEASMHILPGRGLCCTRTGPRSPRWGWRTAAPSGWRYATHAGIGAQGLSSEPCGTVAGENSSDFSR